MLAIARQDKLQNHNEYPRAGCTTTSVEETSCTSFKTARVYRLLSVSLLSSGNYSHIHDRLPQVLFVETRRHVQDLSGKTLLCVPNWTTLSESLSDSESDISSNYHPTPVSDSDSDNDPMNIYGFSLY